MPSEIAIQVPRLGLSVEEVRIMEWVVEDGMPVQEGDLVCLIETDKATNEIEAPASGALQHKAAVDEICKIGATIGAVAPGRRE